MHLFSKFSSIVRVNQALKRTPSIVSISKYRFYSTDKENRLTQSKERSDVSTDVRPVGEKIKEATKTASYTGIILVGVGVTGVIFYYVFRELFSSNSPNSIYSVALEKCKNNLDVEDALGPPIIGYGEETTRRRRTHVSHAVYEKDGVKHMRMRFYIKGLRNKGVVELDMKQNAYGNYQCRYLLVQLNDYSGKTFIIEDNRGALDHNKSDFETQLPTLTLTQ